LIIVHIRRTQWARRGQIEILKTHTNHSPDHKKKKFLKKAAHTTGGSLFKMIKKKKKTRFSLSNIWSRQRRNFFRGENKNLLFPSQISQKVQVFLSCPFFSFSPLFSLNKSVTELKLKKKYKAGGCLFVSVT
jgi:hypothetical protein